MVRDVLVERLENANAEKEGFRHELSTSAKHLEVGRHVIMPRFVLPWLLSSVFHGWHYLAQFGQMVVVNGVVASPQHLTASICAVPFESGTGSG